ncbi:MAG: hypothetical protein KJP23_14765 [Deltaproteobacteria bacterium]|nr:hypothetical protein [Deltaproteobacteria bacterium]
MTAPFALRHTVNRLLKAFTVAPISVLLCFFQALGHERIDAEHGAEYLKRIRELNAVIEQENSTEQRGEALVALGETVARIVESLNRDLQSHYGELGLASTVIVHELKAEGIELTLWPEAMRYKRYVKPYEQYVTLLPEGPRRDEALFRILQGRFYDSFIYDPLQQVNLGWFDLVVQIQEEEAFLARYPDFPNREEVLFILIVDCVRAVHQALDANSKPIYTARARVLLQEFFTTYPNSLRVSAAQMLLQNLPAVE